MPATIFPDQAQKVEIQKTLTEIFEGLTEDLKFKAKKFHVAFDESPKDGMVNYLKDNNAHLVITYTAEKQGIKGYFASSFTEFLIKHPPSSLISRILAISFCEPRSCRGLLLPKNRLASDF